MALFHWLKSLSCRHKWQTLYEPVPGIPTYLRVSFFICDYCAKCGKVRKGR